MNRFQTVIVILAAATLGWWAHSTRPVEAQSSNSLLFEFHGLGPESALSVYNPAEQTIYVYQGVVTGYSTLQCSYKFHVPKPGAPIERTNCPIGSFR